MSRESIERMKQAIRNKRVELGLPKEGPVSPQEIIEAIRKERPIKELVGYVKDALNRGKPKV